MALPKIIEKFKNYLPLSGGTITGQLRLVSANNSAQLGCNNATDYGGFYIEAKDANNGSDGARLVLRPAHATKETGNFNIRANDGTNSIDLIGQPNGYLTWGSNHIVRTVNGVAADTAGNVALKAVITETWRSGSSWYRVWSDGWIEQGSKVNLKKQNSASDTKITFFKAYKKAARGVLMTIDGGSGNAFAYANGSSTTGTTIRQTGNGTNYVGDVNWYAYGY